MAQCECGCGQERAGGLFKPGHDQKLRSVLETRVGGLLHLRALVNAAVSYATGHTTGEQLTTSVRQIFATRAPHS